VDWICQGTFAGHRTLGQRDSAEMFATKQDASVAIGSLPSVLKLLGVSFSVEATR
jgi:hypothetical protein